MHALCVYCLEENTDRNRLVNSINKLNQDFKILHVTGLPLHPLFLLLIVTGVHLSKCCIGLFSGTKSLVVTESSHHKKYAFDLLIWRARSPVCFVCGALLLFPRREKQIVISALWELFCTETQRARERLFAYTAPCEGEALSYWKARVQRNIKAMLTPSQKKDALRMR